MNYYDTLEVSQTASSEVVRAAYKSLMQRHHPDKAPASTSQADMAGRAALLAQAYAVLSDPEQRAAYDLRLQSLTNHAPPERRPAPRPAPAASDTSSWLAWLLILVLVSSGGLIVLLSKKPPATPPQAVTLGQQATGTTGTKPNVLLLAALTVRLKTAAAEPLAHTHDLAPPRTLSIPTMVLQIGPLDSAKTIEGVEQRREAITVRLADDLALASYQNLITPDGENYLRKIILKAVQEVMATHKGQATAAPLPEDLRGRYGVTDVLLPASFSLQ